VIDAVSPSLLAAGDRVDVVGNMNPTRCADRTASDANSELKEKMKVSEQDDPSGPHECDQFSRRRRQLARRTRTTRPLDAAGDELNFSRGHRRFRIHAMAGTKRPCPGWSASPEVIDEIRVRDAKTGIISGRETKSPQLPTRGFLPVADESRRIAVAPGAVQRKTFINNF